LIVKIPHSVRRIVLSESAEEIRIRSEREREEKSDRIRADEENDPTDEALPHMFGVASDQEDCNICD